MTKSGVALGVAFTLVTAVVWAMAAVQLGVTPPFNFLIGMFLGFAAMAAGIVIGESR